MQQLLKLTQSGTPQQSNLPQQPLQQEYRTQSSSQTYQVSSTPDYRAGNSYNDDYDEYDVESSSSRSGGRSIPQDRDWVYHNNVAGRGRGITNNTACRYFAAGRCLKGSQCPFRH